MKLTKQQEAQTKAKLSIYLKNKKLKELGLEMPETKLTPQEENILRIIKYKD